MQGGKRLMILNRDPLSSHPFSHCHVTTSPKSHYNPTQKAHTHTHTHSEAVGVRAEMTLKTD